MKRSLLWDFAFSLPCFLAFLLVILCPFFLGAWYSFTDWNGISYTVSFVGLANYRNIFSSPQFLFSLRQTLLYALLDVVFIHVVAFGLALLVTSRVRLRNVYRAGFFLPNLIGGIVLGFIWQFMYKDFFTAIGKLLDIAGMKSSLISNVQTVVLGMSIATTWQYAGYIMLIFVAAIQGVSQEILESAAVDGASAFIRVRKILIPMMRNAFTISLFLVLTTSFKQFEKNLTLTNGGPATRFLGKVVQGGSLVPLTIYNESVSANNLSKGQAMSVVFFLVLVAVSLLQVALSKRGEVEQ
jgi:raffinose/stachyose/melibiose transport system permease protein